MGIIISRPVGLRPAGELEDPVYIPYLGINTGNYGNSSADLPPIPLEWIIAPVNATEGQCPSRDTTLRTFGITNIVVAVLAIIFGCRPIVHKLTFGYLGKRGGSTIKWMWIVSLALQLLSNVSVSLMITRTPGYEHLSMLNIFALYSARPRVNLVVLAILRSVVAINLRRLRKSEKYDDKVEFVYADSYITTAIAELCMQIFAAIFIGITWNRFPNEKVKDYMNAAYKFMEALPAWTLVAIGVFVPFYRRKGDAIPTREERIERSGAEAVRRVIYHGHRNIWCHRVSTAMVAMLFVGFGFLWQWVYFSSFLQLPGSLWCPPKLVEQAVIWIVFSTLGNFVGAGA